MHIRVFSSIQKLRGRRLRVLCKKYVLKIFEKLTKTTVVDFYFTKAAGLLRATLQKQGSTTRVFL